MALNSGERKVLLLVTQKMSAYKYCISVSNHFKYLRYPKKQDFFPPDCRRLWHQVTSNTAMMENNHFISVLVPSIMSIVHHEQSDPWHPYFTHHYPLTAEEPTGPLTPAGAKWQINKSERLRWRRCRTSNQEHKGLWWHSVWSSRLKKKKLDQ